MDDCWLTRVAVDCVCDEGFTHYSSTYLNRPKSLVHKRRSQQCLAAGLGKNACIRKDYFPIHSRPWVSQKHQYTDGYCLYCARGRFLGMAEMTGPYEPYARPIFSADKRRDTVGVIPMQWLVAKDVPFSFFDHLRHGQVPVTEVRHANPIPGKVGRDAVQKFFEAAHADYVSLLPRGGFLENQPLLHHSGYRPYGHTRYPYGYSPAQVHQPADARLYNPPAPVYHPQGRPTVNSYMPQAVNPGFNPFPVRYQPRPSPNVNRPMPAYQIQAPRMTGRSPCVDVFTPVYPNGAPCVPGEFPSVGPPIPAYQDRGHCASGPFPSVSSSRVAFQHRRPHGRGPGSMYQSKGFPNVSPPTSPYHSDHSQSQYQTKNVRPVLGFIQQGAYQAGFQQTGTGQPKPCVAGLGRVTQIPMPGHDPAHVSYDRNKNALWKGQ